MQTCTYMVRSTSFFLRSQHKKVCVQHDNSERGIASRGELERLLQKIIVAPARNRFLFCPSYSHSGLLLLFLCVDLYLTSRLLFSFTGELRAAKEKDAKWQKKQFFISRKGGKSAQKKRPQSGKELRFLFCRALFFPPSL